MKYLRSLLIAFVFSSCMTAYPLTTFYVKNNSDKPVNFRASITKYSSMTGPFEMTLPFTVPPKDSVLARKAGFRKDALPTAWFTSFIIFPVSGVVLNDPHDPANWIQSKDSKGKTVYTFNIVR